MTTENNPDVVHTGAVARYQHGQFATPEPLHVAPSLRVAGTVHSINFGAETQQTETQFARHEVGETTQTHSVSATLKKIGGHNTVELIPGNPSSRTRVEQAVKDGLIERVDGGNFRDVRLPRASDPLAQGSEGDSRDDPTEPKVQDPGARWFKPDEDAAFNADIEPLPQHIFDSVAASATVAALDGTTLDAAAAKLSREHGMNPSDAMEFVDNAYNYYEGAVARAMVPEGITEENKQDFYAFLRSKKGDLQNAIQQLRYERDMTGFRNLAALYRGKVAAREHGSN